MEENINWSPEQILALNRVKDWLRDPWTNGRGWFYLAGYAGTGKTTLAKSLVESVPGVVLFGAYTGKASHVLRSKGCPANTLHSLIYKPKNKSSATLLELEGIYSKLVQQLKAENADVPSYDVESEPAVAKARKAVEIEKDNLKKPSFALNPDSELLNASLLVVDEVSMVGRQMGEDLLSFQRPILVLGDPAQLPPVADAGFFTNHEPDFMLTEIHRQAQGNPIIQLATTVRHNKVKPQAATYGESVVTHERRVKINNILSADQILVGKNATRATVNQRVRALRGFTGEYPNVGEKLVCLRNNHELGLMNGSLWIVEKVEDDFPAELDHCLNLTVRSEDSDLVVENIDVHKHHFVGAADQLDYWTRRDAEEFDFGYALTVHKSQGSQWKSVFIFDESSSFRADWHRWFYTAITRASERVQIVLNY